MYAPVSDDLLKASTHLQKLDYLHTVQDYLQKYASELELDKYYFDPDHCSINYINQWGIYSIKPPLFTEDTIVKMMESQISKWANILVSKAFKANKSNYKMIMTHIQRYLTHLIPTEEKLAEMHGEADMLIDKIDDSYVAEDYSYNKKQLILSQGYVYAIAINDEIVYVGYTARPLLTRLREHWDFILHPQGQDLKYSVLHDNIDNVTFKLLYQVTNGITEQELKNIERALIEAYRPKFNIEGINIVYGQHDLEYQRQQLKLPFYQEEMENIATALQTLNEKFEKWQQKME